MSRRRICLTGGLLAVVAIFLASCASNAPQDSLDPAGPYARQIDALFRPVFWIATAVFVLVEGLIVVAVIRFRQRGEDDDRVPEQVHGNRRLEIMWTIAPAVLLAVIAVPTIATIFSLAARPAGALDVRVIGHQFWFEVQYPGKDVVTANEMHIPVGQPVYVTIESVDVIHSFWVPRLAGKQDLVPGSVHHLKLEADEPGLYEGQCAEYCGESHANMQFAVVAQTRADFNAWVAGQQQPAAQPPADVLASMTGTGCGGCHAIVGVQGFERAEGKVGPDLTHFASRSKFAGWIFVRTPENVYLWIHDAPSRKPGNDMPNFSGQLSKDQIDAIVQYLESLK
jgi:cytochrome c oxidase subunit 2